MRYSRMFIPTIKETPSDAEVASHRLLLRAGYMRQLGAGIYSYLPLLKRVLSKVESIVREEMNAIGGQEFFLPALHPKEVWEESGRWEVMGQNMFRFKDRKGADLGLGMTHEEIFTYIARDELRSYRQLPQTWYQIQTKFRDEPRPKSGLLRVRQFTMKDSYSFDLDQAGLDKSFDAHREAYVKIFGRCGLSFVQVEAHSGSMGGSASTEFMVRTNAGEDDVAACPKCGYAANTEKATSRVAKIEDEKGPDKPELFPTPGVRTIEDLTKPPFNVAAHRQIKTLVYAADGKPVLALVRGDQELNEAKLQGATGANEVRPAHPEEIQEWMGAAAGSLGAVGKDTGAPFEGRIWADLSLQGRENMVTGANKDEHHLKGVTPGRDFQPKWADLRTAMAGEGCPRCEGTLDLFKALEIGHIFKLGTKYSESMGAKVLDEKGQEKPIIMGSYGIGVERVAAAAVELYHDEDGIRWPLSIAPFHATVLSLQARDPEVGAAAEKLVGQLEEAGVETLYDDRDERPGIKFKDADLVGIPLRFAVGKKGLAEGKVELKIRGEKEMRLLTIEEAVAEAKARVDKARAR
ncbi:MAG TPA: proline--tRNA ligase [Myxococcales bacterium]|nr:proline--tRNA ligase [Myxococcales bacterium]